MINRYTYIEKMSKTYSAVAVGVHEFSQWRVFFNFELDDRVVLSHDFQVDVFGFSSFYFLKTHRNIVKISRITENCTEITLETSLYSMTLPTYKTKFHGTHLLVFGHSLCVEVKRCKSTNSYVVRDGFDVVYHN